ncbi:MAG: hypothetical protein ACI814_002362 [Mariniblastus sp.]|jgi:hypothetical protein
MTQALRLDDNDVPKQISRLIESIVWKITLGPVSAGFGVTVESAFGGKS